MREEVAEVAVGEDEADDADLRAGGRGGGGAGGAELRALEGGAPTRIGGQALAPGWIQRLDRLQVGGRGDGGVSHDSDVPVSGGAGRAGAAALPFHLRRRAAAGQAGMGGWRRGGGAGGAA